MNLLDTLLAIAVAGIVAGATLAVGTKLLQAVSHYDPAAGIEIMLPDDTECLKAHPITGVCLKLPTSLVEE